MKKLHAILGILTTLTLSTTAWADIYDLNYTAATSDNTLASGQITVINSIATGGSLDVTTGPDAGNYTLVPGNQGDSYFTFDNIVTPGSSSGFLDSTGGLLLSVSGNAGDSTEVNLWYNPTAQWGAPADSYSLWGEQYGSYNLSSYGAATLTPAPVSGFLPQASAPDGTHTAGLLGCAMIGLVAFRRKLAR